MHTRTHGRPLRALRAALTVSLLAGGQLLPAATARAQNFWHVTAPPEVVLGWQPRTVEEAARGPYALRDRTRLSAPARASAAPLALTNGTSATWHELGPPIRAYHALVYDSRRHRFLQVGGNGFNGQSGSSGLDPQGSIWSFDLTSPGWTEIARTPWSVSYVTATTDAVYDSLRDRLIVVARVSGMIRIEALGLSGASGWENLWTFSAPNAIGVVGMALDTRRDLLALRGMWNDTSRFVRIPLANPEAWASVTLAGARVWEAGGGAMVFDPSRDRYYLSRDANPALWSLDAANPAVLEPIPFPEQNYLPIRVLLDAARDRLIGVNNSGIAWAVPLSGGGALKLDDRAYGGGEWDFGPAFAFDPVGRRIYRSGGVRNSAHLPVLESVTVDSGVVAPPGVSYPVAAAWREEPPLAMGSRYWGSAVLDANAGRLIVLGGLSGSPARRYDSHAMSRPMDGSGGWSRLGPGSVEEPPLAYGTAAVLDPTAQSLLSYGGQTFDGSVHGVLWRLPLARGGTWARVEFTGETPPARRYAMLFHDEPHGRFILIGGDDASRSLYDAWELRLAPSPVWRRLSFTSPSPSPYWAVFPDPLGGDARGVVRNRVFRLVLGEDAIVANEEFELFPEPMWSLDPNYALAGFDPIGRRFLLFSMFWVGIPRSKLDQAWWVSLLPGHVRTQAPISSSVPQTRGYYSSVFDPDGQRLLLVGGYDDDLTYFGDAWQLTMPPMHPTPVAASLRFAESDARGVRLAWLVTDAAGTRARVERSADGVSWTGAGEARWSAADELSWEGPPLAPRASVAFRLVLSAGAGETRTAPAWVSGPGAGTLAIAPLASPAGPDLALRLSLAPGAPARLRVLDAAGRVVGEARLPEGATTWSFGRAAAPGLYFAELTQGRERRVTKLVTLR